VEIMNLTNLMSDPFLKWLIIAKAAFVCFALFHVFKERVGK